MKSKSDDDKYERCIGSGERTPEEQRVITGSLHRPAQSMCIFAHACALSILCVRVHLMLSSGSSSERAELLCIQKGWCKVTRSFLITLVVNMF